MGKERPVVGQLLTHYRTPGVHGNVAMRMPPLSSRRGVTLTEIVVAIAIILVLATLSFVGFSSAKKFADKTEHATQTAVLRVNAAGKKANNAPVPPFSVVPPFNAPRQDRIPGQYFVGFQKSVTDPHAEARRLAAMVGGRVLGVYPRVIFGCGLQCDDAKSPLLANDSAVTVVDQAIPVFPCQAPMNIQRVNSNGIFGQTTKPMPLKMYGAPLSIYRKLLHPVFPPYPLALPGHQLPPTTPVQRLTVAIMDTGIDSRHPDLLVLDAHDFTGGSNPIDTDGHGTHVAGVVGALDKTAVGGVVGVYPGAQLINLKIMNGVSGVGTPNDALNPPGTNLFVYGALTWLIDNVSAVPVCLMSFQTAPATVDLRMNELVNTAANLGCLMIAAAGNESIAGKDLRVSGVSPATAAGAIAVGAISDFDGLPGKLAGGTDDIFISYSNYGANVVVLAAPGGSLGYSIKSTTPISSGVLYSTFINNAGALRVAWGTSFSAAHVAGMMAQLKDPQSAIGFHLGNGGGITGYQPQMRNRAEAIAALVNATHQTTPFQMVNPMTGSAWFTAGFPPTAHPYMKSLFNDVVVDPNGHVVPVANFYANPGQKPAKLPPFPG